MKFDRDNKAHFDMKCVVTEHGWDVAIEALAAVLSNSRYNDIGAEQRREMALGRLEGLLADYKKWTEG